MATSGSENFSVTAEDIIVSALRKLKIINDAVPKAYQKHLAPALVELNMLVKAWAVDGLRLWKRETLRVDLLPHKHRYTVGTYSSNVYKIKTRTEVTTAAAAAATSIIVKGVTTQFTVGDIIRIHQSDGTVLQTTIASGITTSGSDVTFVLTDALDYAVVVGAQVETMARDTRLPIRIVNAYRRGEGWADTSSATSDIPIDVVGKDFYMGMNNKRADGPVQYVYYERTLTDGHLHTWPEPSDTDQELYVTALIEVEDFDSLSDNPDFPKEWYLALVYSLATILADNYESVKDTTLVSVTQKAAIFYQNAADNSDTEEGSVYLQPDMRNRKR